MSGKRVNRANGAKRGVSERVIEPPSTSDGADIWQIARDSGKLDLNSSYAYVLWCHDFADTSVVARVDGEVVGFVTGYVRPAAPDTLVVWQVAVRDSQRGRGTAGALLDALLEQVADQGVEYLQTTITADNTASNALFSSLAKRWDTTMRHADTLGAEKFPDAHEPELVYRIGPFSLAHNRSLPAVGS